MTAPSHDRARSDAQDVEIVSHATGIAFTDDWYEFAVDSHFWFAWRQAALLKQIQQVGISRDTPLKVLEVGCGTGVLRAGLERVTNWNIDGADLNLAALSRAPRSRGRTMFYDIRDEKDALLEAYDLVILFDVLEHIHDTQPFLRSVLRHLAPGGYLLVNVPALQCFYSVYDRIMGHVRRYDKRTLAAEFRDTELALADLRYWGVSLLPMLSLRSMMLGRRKRTDTDIVRLGFRPPGALVNAMLRGVMRVETTMLRAPAIGTSLLLVGHKPTR